MAAAKKKVYILDGGSLVIDRSQVLWHIDVGTPVRFPVYSVLIEHLTGATTLVNTAELRHSKVPEPFEHLGYSDLSFDFPGTRYERISGDIEIADGIWLCETPGHTRH
jgi:hypothetical protein